MRTKTYKSNHEVEILAELNNERKALQNSCDVTLTAGSRSFPVHRCILMAFSIFFKKLFTCEMKEKHENKAHVQRINEETLDTILDFIYSCHVKITSENVYDLLEASDFLEIPSLKDCCTEFLLEETDSDNCLGMRSYAKLYNIDKLDQKVNEIVKENFEAVIQSKEFKELEFDDVSKLMQIEEKQVSSEENVFHSLIGWINHNPSTRHLKLNKAFNLVNIDALSLDFLHNVVAKESLIMNSVECLKLCFLSITSSNRGAEGSFGNVGMEKRKLPDSSITASSSYSNNCLPQYGRLNNQQRAGYHQYAGCWIPKLWKAGEYIQIQLERPTRVIGVVTQGSSPPYTNYWTRTFTIAYGNATDNMQTIAQDGSDKGLQGEHDYSKERKGALGWPHLEVFQGNVDGNTPVINSFPKPVTARYFRLIVQTWNGCPAIRMELLTFE